MNKMVQSGGAMVNVELDADWIELMQEARRIGLSIGDVQAFFLDQRDRSNPIDPAQASGE